MDLLNFGWSRGGLIPKRAITTNVSRFPAAFIGVQGQVLQDRARRAHPPGLLGDILGQLAHDDAHIPKELQRVAWQMAS
jgi:hypothetical protein